MIEDYNLGSSFKDNVTKKTENIKKQDLNVNFRNKPR